MAPAPEEIDVFSIPHSNIVEQLHELTDKLLKTNFSDHVDWKAMLDKIKVTFRDFKIHEKIENECIMQKLKHRLKGLKIEIAAVTNVHSDNHLTDMLEMVDDGIKRHWDKTAVDRNSFGKLLTKAIREFTKDFLPHLREEEEVFQELLMRYFSYEELKDIKATVIERHSELHRKLKYMKDTVEKPTEDEEDETEEDSKFELLPTEIILKIFSLLSPKDLCRCAQVCTRWSKLAYAGSTWQTLYPCRWAKGMWEFGNSADCNMTESSESDSSPANSGSEDELYVVVDEDADFDESEESDDSVSSTLSYAAMCIRKEAKMLTDVAKYLIPVIGPIVRTSILSKSKGVTNGLVYKMIISCPNLEHLDLKQTNISDVAFKGLGRNGAGSQLKHLDLSGCLKITDTTLIRLATSLGMNPPQVEMCCQGVCFEDNDARNTTDGGVSMATRTFNNDEIAIESCNETLWKFAKWKFSADEHVKSECSNVAPTGCNSCVDDGNKRTKNCCRDTDTEGVCVVENARTCTGDRYFGDSNRSCCSSYGESDKNRTSMPLAAASDFDKNSRICCDALPDNNNTRTAFCSGSGSCWQRGDSDQISRPMEFLGLSSCYQITDEGLRALASNGGLPNLVHLDLSGCLNVTAAGLQELAEACPNLKHEQFFYCDNITEGPYQESASGCQNLQCRKRVCCRLGE